MADMRLFIFDCPVVDDTEKMRCCEFTDEPTFEENDTVLVELSLEEAAFTKLRLLLELFEPTGNADDVRFSLEEVVLRVYAAGVEAGKQQCI